MSVDFNRIKKYSKPSKDIDEKLEYLNKELKKTGIHEGMVTSKMYQMPKEVPNQDYINFNGLSHGGYALGLSAADGNGLGGAILGTNSQGATGVALSPPHPITGVRTAANHLLDGIGTGHPLQPGKSVYRGFFTKTLQTMGSALWFFDPNYNFGNQQGRWLNFEMFDGNWCFYDTTFLGFFFPNSNLDEFELGGVNIGTQIKNKITGINFGAIGEIGPPQNIILTQTKLSDPGFLPIPIEGLSTQGFNYLKGKAGVNVSSSYYSIEDKKNVINYYKKKQADPNYQPKPYERESLMRQMRAQGDGTQIASTDPSAAFSSASPDAFEPETVETELTPADIPDEFKIGSNTNTTDESKPTEEGKKVKLTKWMSRTDYMSKYPNTSVVDYLSSLPYGPSDFMTPNPNYPGAWDLNTKGYENYFLNGDLSALGNRDGIPKPRHSTATAEPEKEGKTKEEIIADLDKTIEKYSTMEKEAYAEMRRIALELGMDFVSLIGGLFTGGTTAAPVLGKLGMKLLKKYGKTVAGKMIRKLIKKFRNKKNSKQLDELLDDIDNAEAQEYDPRKPFEPDAGDQYPNLTRKGEQTYDTATERLLNQRQLGGPDGDLAGRLLDDLVAAAPKGDAALNSVMNKIKKSPIGYLFNSYKPDGKLLSEAAKLGHFEPEALTVDIEDLRKGIVPEFPKDPPPKLIGGYSEKSRLAPVKTSSNSSAADIGKKPFIKITKKDIARNHLLTDSDIKEFMDTINKVNEYIKNHPEELIYAQERYPFHDPRLAQLNWEMDEMLGAGKEYVDKQFPENQRLFNRIQKKIKNTIDQTDPKNFKGTKLPKFDKTSLEDFKRKKEVYSRFMKKPVKTKNRFHLDMKDVKKTHLKKLAAEKIKEEENKKEKKVIQEIAKKHKSDWRKDLREDFTNITTGNKVGQTFRHNPTGATFTSSGGLGGVESAPKTVTLDLGLDGKFTVDAPTYDQLALAGYAKPIVMQNKKLEDTNPKLDASQEFAKKVGADYMMNARVKDAISSALSDDLGYKSTEDILGEVGDQWTYPEYMAMLDAIADRAAAAEEPIAKEIAEYGPDGTKTGDVPISLIDAQEAITNARNKAEQALHDAWERYNKIPEPQDGFGGGQGNPTNKRGSGFPEGEMNPDGDTETEAKPEKEDEFRKARVNRRGPSVGNTGISENDADTLISGASKFSKELQVFLQYLFNKGPKIIDNNHLGRNHVLKLFKDGFINSKGKFAVDDFIVGSGQKLTFNQKTGLYSVKFTYDFDDNATEIFKDPEKYRFMPGIHPKNFFLNARVILGGNYGLDGLGVPGRLIEIAKAFGGGKSKPGEITISHEDLLKQNPSLVQQTGSVWNQSMMGTPKGSDPEVTHNYYAVYGKLPPRAVIKGSVPYNYGDYPEYDPKVIERIKSEKRSSKTQTKEPSKSKTVERIKSMSKTRNQSLSLDEPIVRRKKKRG